MGLLDGALVGAKQPALWPATRRDARPAIRSEAFAPGTTTRSWAYGSSVAVMYGFQPSLMEDPRETFQAIDDAWPSLADLTFDIGDADEALLSAELEIDASRCVVDARESVKNVQIRSRNHAPHTDVSRNLISMGASRLGDAEASLLAFHTAGFVE